MAGPASDSYAKGSSSIETLAGLCEEPIDAHRTFGDERLPKARDCHSDRLILVVARLRTCIGIYATRRISSRMS